MPFAVKTTPVTISKTYDPKFLVYSSYNTYLYWWHLAFFRRWSQHLVLLDQFYQIIKDYEIMLSKKKIIIRVCAVDFMGMHLDNCLYHPQPHIGLEIKKFSDVNLTLKSRSFQMSILLKNKSSNFFVLSIILETLF